MPYDGTSLSLMTPTQKNLIAARKLVEDGWCREHLVIVDKNGENPHYCMMGAIRMVVHSDPYYQCRNVENPSSFWRENSVRVALLRAINQRSNPSIEEWNDRKSRTKKQVLAMFDKAIKEAGE